MEIEHVLLSAPLPTVIVGLFCVSWTWGPHSTELPQHVALQPPPTLLQVAVQPPPTVLKRPGCLNFLHIPKTGGTSIEDSARYYRRSWGMNDNRLVEAYQQDNEANGFCGNTTACKRLLGCPAWHIPPGWSSGLRHVYGRCTTFCVVRHPVRRLVSAASFKNVPCDSKELSRWLQDRIKDYRARRVVEDCHFLSQSEYIYGGSLRIPQPSGEPKTWNWSQPAAAVDVEGMYCQRILRFENYSKDFASLMKEFKLEVKILTHRLYHRCDASPDAETVELIKRIYRSDFENFGYAM